MDETTTVNDLHFLAAEVGEATPQQLAGLFGGDTTLDELCRIIDRLHELEDERRREIDELETLFAL